MFFLDMVECSCKAVQTLVTCIVVVKTHGNGRPSYLALRSHGLFTAEKQARHHCRHQVLKVAAETSHQEDARSMNGINSTNRNALS